jgi:phosphoglycolate phosphatase-like HAD superfamily hydrolase
LMYHNAIFDLDGGLIDSKVGFVAGLCCLVWQLRQELPADRSLDWAIGPPLKEVMARLLAAFSDLGSEVAGGPDWKWCGDLGLFDARPFTER